MTDTIRLSKRLIELLACSRREADLYIEGGWVTVDGEVVEAPQFKVAPDQDVALLAGAVAAPVEPVTLLLHATAAAQLPQLSHSQHWPDDPTDIRPLHRHLVNPRLCLPLPRGAEGLQVLTQDWRTERKLKDDAGKLEQEFVVEVTGSIAPDGIARLNRSSSYAGVVRQAQKVSWQSENRLRFALKNPPDGLIQELCASVGLTATAIKRIRIGAVAMAKLPREQWRYLGPRERF